MPPVGMGAAALMAGGMGASAVGSVMSARAGAPKNVPTTAPNPLFPWLQNSYTSQLGQVGSQGLQGLGQMAETGNPTDVGDAFSQMLVAQQKTLAQGRAGLREQFGASGAMGSSAFRDAAVDFEGQANKDFMSLFSNMMMTSKENAAGRQLNAQSILSDLFSSAGTAFTPSSTLVSGAPSAAGQGLSSMGQMMTLLSFLNKK